jgi:hypothetical protein
MATLVDYEVTAPDGTELIVTGPEGATQEQIIKAAQEQYKSRSKPKGQPTPDPDPTPTPAKKDYTDVGLGQVAEEAVSGFGASAKREAMAIWDAVSSPIETAKTVGQLGYGILQNTLPDEVVQLIGEDEESQQLASAVGEYVADRYGGIENIKRTVATDSAGFMADLAGVLSGGATIAAKVVATAAKAGRGAKLARVPAALEKFAKNASRIDPITSGLLVAGKIAKVGNKKLIAPAVATTLSFTSGTGREAVSQAYKAGKEGGDAVKRFRDSLTGKADPTEVVANARFNLDILYKQRRKNYLEGKANLKDINLSLSPVLSKLAEFQNKRTTNASTIEAAEKAAEILQRAEKQNYKSLADFDELKRTLNSEAMNYTGEARSALSEMAELVRKSIDDVDPNYGKVMKSYENASKIIQEIEKALSVGNNKTAEVALKKLLTSMRDGVSTNYGQRLNLAQELEGVTGGKKFMSQLAGQELSSVVPRGLQGRVTSALATGGAAYGVGAGMLSPSSLLPLALASPRFVGEASQLAGRTARRAQQAAQVLPSATPSYLGMFERSTQEEQ